jgi:hypothetical protein
VRVWFVEHLTVAEERCRVVRIGIGTHTWVQACPAWLPCKTSG